jgi:hypothetical protein
MSSESAAASSAAPPSPQQEDKLLQFRAILPPPQQHNGDAVSSNFASLCIESLSAPMRQWLGLRKNDAPDSLHRLIKADAAMELNWPTQQPDIVEAYAQTSYLAFGRVNNINNKKGTSCGAGGDAAAAQVAAAPTFTEERPLRVRIGERNANVDALLAAHGSSSGTFITGWNPCSEMQPDDVNAAAHARMVALVEQEGRSWMEHIGRGDPPPPAADGSSQPVWEEHGLFVLGWTRAQALQMASRFAQNAVVFCEPGLAARLEWTFGPNWPASFSVGVRVTRAGGGDDESTGRITARAAEYDGPLPVPRIYDCTLQLASSR